MLTDVERLWSCEITKRSIHLNKILWILNSGLFYLFFDCIIAKIAISFFKEVV